jgi:hypothetical protein
MNLLIIVTIILALLVILLAYKNNQKENLINKKTDEYQFLHNEYSELRITHANLKKQANDAYNTYHKNLDECRKNNSNESLLFKWLIVKLQSFNQEPSKFIQYLNEGTPKSFWVIYDKETKSYIIKDAFGSESIEHKIDFKLDDKSLKTIINDYFNSKLFIENYNIDKTKTNEDFELIKNIYKSIK